MAGVSGGWVGVDKAREQDSAEAWKMLVNRAESQPSAARRVGRLMVQLTMISESWST